MAGNAMVRIAIADRKGALLVSIVLTTFMSMLRCVLLVVVAFVGRGAILRTTRNGRSRDVGWREVVIGLVVT